VTKKPLNSGDPKIIDLGEKLSFNLQQPNFDQSVGLVIVRIFQWLGLL